MNTRTIPKWQVGMRQRRTQLLNRLLLLAVIGGAGLLAFLYFAKPGGLAGLGAQGRLSALAPFIAAWLMSVTAWIWEGLSYRVRALMLLLGVYIAAGVIFARAGMVGSGRLWLILLPVLAFVLMRSRFGVFASVVSVLIYAFFTLLVGQGVLPLNRPGSITVEHWISEGGDFLVILGGLILILQSLERRWSEMLEETSTAKGQLQARTEALEDTTTRLRQQTSQLQAVTEIVRAGSSILDPEELMPEVVNRIQEGFEALGVYYVGLFLLDERGRFAVLKAATGEAGKLLLAMEHRLAVDETTTIGQCISREETVVRSDIEEGTRFDALPMPNTRSEIALPLRSRGRVLGALSVQSTRRSPFGDADVSILQTMADQVALAIDNARLFSRTESALEEVRAAHKRYLAQEWHEFLAGKPPIRIDHTASEARPEVNDLLREARREALKEGRTVVAGGAVSSVGEFAQGEEAGSRGTTDSDHAALVVPLKLRGQVIGTMALRGADQRPWAAEEINVAETVAEQVAQTVENLRLMNEAQRQAAREQVVGEATARMRESLNVEAVLRRAVDEIQRALALDKVAIRLAAEDGDGETV